MKNKIKPHGGNKPVLMIDPITNQVVRRFASMTEAIDEMDPRTHMIRLAIRKKEVFKNHLWEFEKKEGGGRLGENRHEQNCY